MYKIFPSHLKDNELNQVIADSDLVLFLSRNVLHSYISNEMAKKKGTYSGIDTSCDHIEFDSEVFKWWNNFIYAHFNKAKDYAENSNVRTFELHYEDLLANERVEEYLYEVMHKIGISLLKPENYKHGIRRQDIRSRACDKVSNPDTLMDFLKTQNEIRLINVNEKMVTRTLM